MHSKILIIGFLIATNFLMQICTFGIILIEERGAWVNLDSFTHAHKMISHVSYLLCSSIYLSVYMQVYRHA